MLVHWAEIAMFRMAARGFALLALCVCVYRNVCFGQILMDTHGVVVSDQQSTYTGGISMKLKYIK